MDPRSKTKIKMSKNIDDFRASNSDSTMLGTMSPLISLKKMLCN